MESLPQNLKPISDNISLFPKLLPVLSNIGHLDMWLSFNELLADNPFPTNNIAFKLFIEIVDFFSEETPYLMRYSKETTQFWSWATNSVKASFLLFMVGPKKFHVGQ